jgi:hypothetical protein
MNANKNLLNVGTNSNYNPNITGFYSSSNTGIPNYNTTSKFFNLILENFYAARYSTPLIGTNPGLHTYNYYNTGNLSGYPGTHQQQYGSNSLFYSTGTLNHHNLTAHLP